MPRLFAPPTVIAHWDTLIENLQTSSLEFYKGVEEALTKRELPDSRTLRVDWQEGGVLSARREYVRVTRGRYRFDVCAAPFGRGFFVSWWLGEPLPSGVIPTVLTLVAFYFATGMMRESFGIRPYLFLGPMGGLVPLASALLLVLGVFLAIGVFIPESPLDAYIMAIPFIGRAYARLCRPPTYYRLDMALMFQSAVHAAVLDVVDSLTKVNGLRPLSELERKPILRVFCNNSRHST
ncbi:MAG TPA: hypothetical protein VFD92_24235 [Candidatus Binatia bacterium]|nr:hypothetical protein [Candidatus Binatia bacterium]